MTVYAVASDPVLTYTFNYSCKVLNEKLNVYTRTGSIMTVYTVPSDPVLVYTIIFPCTQPPGRKIKCVYENWINYDHVHSHTHAVPSDPVLIYTIIFSNNTLHEKLNVCVRTGSIITVYTVASDPVLVYTIIFSFNTLHVYMETGSLATVYPVLGRVSVPVIQFLITPANVAARKIKCVYENWINYESVPSSRTRLCVCDQFLITPANVAAREIKCVYEIWINYESVPSSRTRLCVCDQYLITPANVAARKIKCVYQVQFQQRNRSRSLLDRKRVHCSTDGTTDGRQLLSVTQAAHVAAADTTATTEVDLTCGGSTSGQ